MQRLAIDQDSLADLCRKHGIARLALFGSVIRDDFTDRSDIDVLVEFNSGKTPGLSFFTIQEELSQFFGRQVDLHTVRSLSKYFRDEVMQSAEVQYEQARS